MAAGMAGAGAIGLMFVAESRRRVSLAQAREIKAAAGPLLTTVGVFRDAPLEEVLAVATELRLAAVQLHGREDDSYVKSVRKAVPVIRAHSFKVGLSRERLEVDPCDAILIDGMHPGSGNVFEWSQARHISGLPRLIVAGGLHPGNVADAIRELRPYGVDVSSGVEESAGIKDHRLIREFVAAAREQSRAARGAPSRSGRERPPVEDV